jgi:hypothetical protein
VLLGDFPVLRHPGCKHFSGDGTVLQHGVGYPACSPGQMYSWERQVSLASGVAKQGHTSNDNTCSTNLL